MLYYPTMKQKVLQMVMGFASAITGKYFLYITRNEHNAPGKTAVQDTLGVWHVGDVYDISDVAYGVSQNGVVESNETQLVCAILENLTKDGHITFYDIGANIGYYGLIAGTRYTATVHSYEPTPEYITTIKTAAYLNHIENRLTTHEVALSDTVTEATLHKSGSGSSLESDFNADQELPTTTVQTTTLDTEIAKGVPTPDFMMIDVEGHELAVLAGGKEMIQKDHPIIFMELCTTLRAIGRQYVNPYYTDTIDLLERLGYQVFLLKDSRALEQWDKTKTVDYTAMFLCLSPTQHQTLLAEVIQKQYTVVS